MKNVKIILPPLKISQGSLGQKSLLVTRLSQILARQSRLSRTHWRKVISSAAPAHELDSGGMAPPMHSWTTWALHPCRRTNPRLQLQYFTYKKAEWKILKKDRMNPIRSSDCGCFISVFSCTMEKYWKYIYKILLWLSFQKIGDYIYYILDFSYRLEKVIFLDIIIEIR